MSHRQLLAVNILFSLMINLLCMQFICDNSDLALQKVQVSCAATYSLLEHFCIHLFYRIYPCKYVEVEFIIR